MVTMNQRLRSIIGSAFGADLVESNIEKAILRAEQRASKALEPVSDFYNPVSLFTGREWLVRAGSSLSAHDLRMMAKNPIIGSIINTRLNQISSFCHISQDRFEPGFEVTSLSGKLSAAKKAEYESFIGTAGMVGYGEPSIDSFMRKFMRDSLILDQATAEIVKSRKGEPAYFVPVDAGTIRLMKESLTFSPTMQNLPFYVQVVDEQITTTYLKDQMMFGVRNASTDISTFGYGQSELELLITTVTTLANAEKYNALALSQGGTKKGVMVVKGEVQNTQFETFKQDFRMAVSNASSSCRGKLVRARSF